MQETYRELVKVVWRKLVARHKTGEEGDNGAVRTR
jgi:hypothetical protein